MRKFNTSGPNILLKHYTIERKKLINKGIGLVEDERYFTIWAPRQTGKSTYFRQLANKLTEKGYKVAHINFENYKNEPRSSFLSRLTWKLEEFWGETYTNKTIGEIFQKIEKNKSEKCVLIIDEVEGINKEYFGDFLHSIRNAYHSRETHCLKSVILVGVSNILGVVSDNASPFNIADNLDVPYFTVEEVHELFLQHETETGQIFDTKTKEKIFQITVGQPGLVNGFAKKMVDDNPEKKKLDYNDYLKVEDWYLTEAIDKNFSNILNKAKEEQNFVERLLFTEDKIPFKIDRPSIKLLHTNGLIKKDKEGYVTFWVPFYKKRLYDAFYPYTNGEQRQITKVIYAPEYFTETGELKLEKLVETYKEYIKRRGFNPHREKDENGKYKSIKEAALIYSFETYIHAFITQTDGKIYRETNTGLGRSDMVLNIKNKEYLIETKIYYAHKQFEDGKKQLAYYCNSLGLDKGVYLVFCPNDIKYHETVKEQVEIIEIENSGSVRVSTYLIEYDEKKWK
ncbi:MAG: ATP-binding protein [Bacteroidota bacterium]